MRYGGGTEEGRAGDVGEVEGFLRGARGAGKRRVSLGLGWNCGTTHILSDQDVGSDPCFPTMPTFPSNLMKIMEITLCRFLDPIIHPRPSDTSHLNQPFSLLDISNPNPLPFASKRTYKAFRFSLLRS